MSKIAVVYWSGTGNTEAMANAVAEGAQAAGAEADVLPAAAFSEELLEEYSAVGFGCPAMGSEELEETEFAPMFEAVSPKLSGRNIAIFGSYAWADGEWMNTWEENCRELGANLVAKPFPCYDAPDDGALDTCREIGKALASA
ncbi:MAG: flavodoxin [Oscillospiraceae bacterium]|nr:flavodoxin [Oscillospiraceae bacterium]